MNDKLIVAETFYSLQCEGRAIGQPAVFLRLGGCNLLCKSSSWVCDTIEVWQKGKAVLFNEVLNFEYVDYLKKGAHLVITGGEPMLHQRILINYLDWFFEKYSFYPFIEVETNGTVIPIEKFAFLVDWWNVSPKLKNSGESFNRRNNITAIQALNSDKFDSIFKFVVSEAADVLEALNDYNVDYSKVILMPAGSTREELDKVRLSVVQICIDLGLRYSERLHIVIWNQKTGV